MFFVNGFLIWVFFFFLTRILKFQRVAHNVFDKLLVWLCMIKLTWVCAASHCVVVYLFAYYYYFFNFIYWYYCFATTVSVCESSCLNTGTLLVHIHILIIWWSSVSIWCCSNRSNFEICSFIALHFLFFIMGLFLYLWVIFWADLDLTFCGCGLHLLFQNICWLVLLRKLLVYTCIYIYIYIYFFFG